MENYWSKTLSRRRILRAGAVIGGIGALGLVGCSSGGDGSSGSSATAFKVYEPSDASKQGKKGGIFVAFATTDETNIDPLTTNRASGYGGPAIGAYSRLLKEKLAPGGPGSPEYMGDAAESWEVGDGGLTLTLKLRPNVKFDPRPPTNGRVVDADDVLFSWDRLANLSQYRTQLSNAASTAAPVQSIQKVDARTIVLKMAFPWVPLLSNLANGVFAIVPKEAASTSTLDVRRDPRGSGPWMLTDWQASTSFSWRRNPNYYDAALPFLEGYDTPIVSEPATRESLFRARQIHSYGPASLEPTTFLSIAKDDASIKAYRGRLGPNVHQLSFGARPDSPWRDVRLRRAVSLAVDRDAFNVVQTAADEFRAAGIDEEIVPDSHLPAYFEASGYWLDPRGKDLGEAAKYFKMDIAEAKKLVAAAGYQNGLEQDFVFRSGSRPDEQNATIIADMLTAAGIKARLKVVDYNTVWLPKIYQPDPTARGDFDGFARFGSTNPLFDLLTTVFTRLHSEGSFTGSRMWDQGQKSIDDTISKALGEFDDNKRKNLIFDMQKQLADYESFVSMGCGLKPNSLVQAWVQNWGFLPSNLSENSSAPLLNVWIDPSLKPS